MRVRVAAGDSVVVEVSDDGVGGADPAGGSGLRGLADRVEALGGSLTVDEPRRRRDVAARRDPYAKPSLPGFMIPAGSSAALIRASVACAAPHWRATYGDSVEPTPWWSLITPPASRIAFTPAPQIS